MWEYLYDTNVNLQIYQTHGDVSAARKAGCKINTYESLSLCNFVVGFKLDNNWAIFIYVHCRTAKLISFKFSIQSDVTGGYVTYIIW